MPTYEYECENCERHFEVFQKMSDAPLTACPECGRKVRRVLSGGIGISFHGSGFYATDSKKPEKTEKKEKTETAKPAPACPADCPRCEKAAS
jgi:putative FmdB family regulatory protein